MFWFLRSNNIISRSVWVLLMSGRFKGYANLSSNETLFCSLTWFSSSRPHSRKRLSGSPSRTYTRDEQNARKKLQGHKERAAEAFGNSVCLFVRCLNSHVHFFFVPFERRKSSSPQEPWGTRCPLEKQSVFFRIVGSSSSSSTNGRPSNSVQIAQCVNVVR